MKKLDRYIIKQFLGTFFYAILVLAVITAVIDYSEKVDDFVKHKAPGGQVLNYYKNFIPYMVAFLFPLFIFISTIFFTSKIAYKSEIIAILSSGVSFPRFVRPYLIGAGFLCVVSLLANHWVVPAANKERLHFEDLYVHEATVASDKNVHLRLTPELYIFLQSYDYMANTGYRFTAEIIKGQEMKEKLIAERVSYDSSKKAWHLYNVTTRVNNGLNEQIRFDAELMRKYPFTPKDLNEDNDIMTAMTTPVLNKVIAREKLRGRENLNQYYVEKHRRTAQPFAGIILTIIGVSIASKKVRGGSGLHLAIGIMISAAYIMSMQFSTTFSTKAGLNPLVAAWIPNMIFSVIALYFFRKQTR
ncbi:MAG: YjgP/YjgQ family permease [Chitinophagaceae bacterium]|nr:MAG: YjgP/YjgQ family permease [Chitinophagaceae bacterium]